MGAGTPDTMCIEASPYLQQGVDILDLDGDGDTTNLIAAGAYITGDEMIGLISGPVDRTPPGTPTGLSVR